MLRTHCCPTLVCGHPLLKKRGQNYQLSDDVGYENLLCHLKVLGVKNYICEKIMVFRDLTTKPPKDNPIAEMNSPLGV